jgi:hypothetical protein
MLYFVRASSHDSLDLLSIVDNGITVVNGRVFENIGIIVLLTHTGVVEAGRERIVVIDKCPYS